MSWLLLQGWPRPALASMFPTYSLLSVLAWDFLVLFFFMSQHLIGPWWMSRNSLIFFREFVEIFVHWVWTSADSFSELSPNYTMERHAFLGYNSWKVKTLRGLHHGKACVSSVKSVESHVICDLFCIKAGSFTVKLAEKVFTFCGLYLFATTLEGPWN